METKQNEIINDLLGYEGLKIIQRPDVFNFSLDSTILADFVTLKEKDSKVIDLGCGNGYIPIFLTLRTNASIYGVEIQNEVSDMAKRSVKLNSLEDKIEILNMDLKGIHKTLGNAKIDAITVNPPYKANNSGIINEKDSLKISRHEICCTLEDIIIEANKLLKFNGKFYMVHRPERLVDIMFLMRKHKLEPKRIRFVYPNKESNANLLLVEGVKNGKPFLKFEKPLYVYDENGNYTDEILKIYNMEKGKI